jgi:hypothetical protein
MAEAEQQAERLPRRHAAAEKLRVTELLRSEVALDDVRSATELPPGSRTAAMVADRIDGFSA